MRYLYTLVTYLLRPMAFAVVLTRGFRNRAYWVGLGERFGWGARLAAEPVIWVHAVSLGEVNLAAGLVRALLTRHAECRLIVTTATLTGRARAQALFGATVTVRFLPYDTPGSMRRFLNRACPRLAIIMETELWPNLAYQCRRRGVPIVFANARLSPRSVRRYRRFGALFRDVFSSGVEVAAQSAEDAARFIEVGAAAAHTQVIGNLKFDLVADPAVAEHGRDLRAQFWPERPVWIAGSTHQGEEDMALTAHNELRAKVANALLLLVPRHPERFQAVADLMNRRGIRFERRSSENPVRADCAVLLVDTVGELAQLYAAADVAFVGGSLVPVGGHNLLEPAMLGVPVITGPYQGNALQVAQLLLRAGAALEIRDIAGLTGAVGEVVCNPELRKRIGGYGLGVIAENRGSLVRLLRIIEPLLGAPPPAAPHPGEAVPGGVG